MGLFLRLSETGFAVDRFISKESSMQMKKLSLGVLGLGILASSALADNPISSYHYLADPGAAADDTYFYVITDSDDPAAYNLQHQGPLRFPYQGHEELDRLRYHLRCPQGGWYRRYLGFRYCCESE